MPLLRKRIFAAADLVDRLEPTCFSAASGPKVAVALLHRHCPVLLDWHCQGFKRTCFVLLCSMHEQHKDDPEALQKAMDVQAADTPFQRMKARIPDSIRNNAVTRLLFMVSSLLSDVCMSCRHAGNSAETLLQGYLC
jgi:hypothetical protein